MGLHNSYYWKMDDCFIVYVENVRKEFIGTIYGDRYEPENSKGKLKHKGRYIKVTNGSAEQVELFKDLRLTPKDEIKEIRKKRVSK